MSVWWILSVAAMTAGATAVLVALRTMEHEIGRLSETGARLGELSPALVAVRADVVAARRRARSLRR